MKITTFILTTIFVVLAAIPAFADSVILPHRVIDARTHTVIDFEGLLARCSEAQVVTIGENHDDPGTHLIELAVMEGLHRLHGDVILSLEMFERDVQNLLDSYLAGDIPEEEFLAGSRPWGNYETDYRPMVELANENGYPVIASNVPRHMASYVASEGIDNADLTDEERQYVAESFEAPEDAYWEKFAETMRMPGMEAMGVTEDTIHTYYQSQVIKDETMAESVSRAAEANPDSIVYHVAGAFHLADYLGTFSRIERNLDNADVVLILVIPVDDILGPLPEYIERADYWILVQAPEEEEMPEMPGMPDTEDDETDEMPPSDDDEGSGNVYF